VNVQNYTASQEVCILLNLEEEGILTYEILKEKSISMACSLAYRLTLQGIGVSMISNGADKITGESLCIESGSDEGHRNTIITSLSRIDLNIDKIDFTMLLEEKRRQLEKASMIVMISTCKKHKLQEEYHILTSDVIDGLWIFPVHHGMDQKFDKLNNGSVIHWEV
jgi:GTPase Era involved in 16S rRNA processing